MNLFDVKKEWPKAFDYMLEKYPYQMIVVKGRLEVYLKSDPIIIMCYDIHDLDKIEKSL